MYLFGGDLLVAAPQHQPQRAAALYRHSRILRKWIANPCPPNNATLCNNNVLVYGNCALRVVGTCILWHVAILLRINLHYAAISSRT